jgi:hypothetical protein
MTTPRYGITFSSWPMPDRMRRGAMIKFLPWDVWAAGLLAAGVVLAAIFDPAPIVFIVVYLALCAYIVVETFSSKPG